MESLRQNTTEKEAMQRRAQEICQGHRVNATKPSKV